MTHHTHYDALETRDPLEREAQLFQRLPQHLAWMHSLNANNLPGVGPDQLSTCRSREALSRLPVLRKHQVLERQQHTRGTHPFGGLTTTGYGPAMPRVFASPGPIYEPEGHQKNHWRMARALYAAGFRPGELVHNSFSYHMTPAGSMMETGAHALGASVFPGGTGNTEQQLQAMVDLRPAGYCGTPSFLRILLEKAQETGVALPFLTKAMVSSEACPPSLRDWFASRGVQVFQCYATADVGLIAYETSAREGLVVDEDVILEIVRPGTGDPVADGEVGEVVVTTFNTVYPLVRFGTGDLSAVLSGNCPTGRTHTRIRGWMGRADQTTKVRGMFVHPSQVAEICKRHPGVAKSRLVVSGAMANDQMTLRVETTLSAEQLPTLLSALEATAREVTKLRCQVEHVVLGTLPNDGKVIEDTRQLN